MSRRPRIPPTLSPSAEVELDLMIRLCRRLRLSRSKVAKVKRIVRIMFETAEKKKPTRS